ncbi:MAG: ATP-binding cassette domain-containing protein [Desulfonauticus sp.]|nr:ATP-binding cassette domain-containing protein [Desulfonauticus sp.]
MKIRLENICKYYGKVKANDKISFTIEPNSIHGILGENGAGKSTLMKILAGFTPKTSGKIFINGQMVNYNTPTKALELGIGMLYQDPQDFAGLTVLENFLLGLKTSWKIKEYEYTVKLTNLCQQLGFKLQPEAYLKDLTVGERQQLEIVRLLALGVEVLILDEPSTGISTQQKQILFTALKRLAKQGKSILLVSHKLEDITELCDQVTVLSNGQVTGEFMAPLDTEQLLECMFGQKLKQIINSGSIFPQPKNKSTPLVQVRDICSDHGRIRLKNCSLSIYPGEIIGIAGLENSGQELFLRILAGLVRPQKGTITINGKNLTEKNNRTFLQNHIHFIPTNRLEEGLFADLTLLEHYLLVFQQSFWLKSKSAYKLCLQKIEDLKIKGLPNTPAKALSGGNQQRLLLSLLPRQAKLLILEHPTRGLDVESALWVWQYLQKCYGLKASIVFSSPELDEIFQVAHKVIVFYNGQILLSKKISDTTPEEVGNAIAGKVEHA